MLVTHNNRVLINDFGQVLKKYEIPKIELTTRRTQFPYYNNPAYPSGRFMLTTSQPNTIYIDWGDGSPIYEREFSGNLEFRTNTPPHVYTDGVVEHKIKIWFKLPSKITAFSSTLVELFGEFPRALSLYSLNNLIITGSYNLNDFPLDFGAGIFNYIHFDNATSLTLNAIPLWMTKSRISRLDLGVRFSLGNPLINNVDKLINVKDLSSMTFTGGNVLSDVSSNFKDISTLRYLSIGGNNPISSITQNINACKQIQYLGVGYVSHTNFGSVNGENNAFNSWGYGLTEMTNLMGLYIGICPNMPTTIPIGLEDCINIKTLNFVESYQTIDKITDVVSNYYNFVILNASMTLGNTKFRQITFNITRSTSNLTPRPTGIYQAPSGYIQGSANGTPASPMEMIYVLVKQYRWSVTITNTAGTGNELLTP